MNEKQSMKAHDLSDRFLKSEKAFSNLSGEKGTIVVSGSFCILFIIFIARGFCDGRQRLFASSIRISCVVKNGP
jgi:hypothetical protein